jgi:nicotinamide-nucleotide amidase
VADAGPTDAALYALAVTVGRRLRTAELTLATAESCTGGWIAKALTDVPGSSQWFGWGWVSYSNAAKAGMLGVTDDLLARHGAVSAPVALALATEARRRSGAALALAVTGIAGPDGGTAAKPVGTVWFAWVGREPGTAECRFGGSREAIRRATVAHALAGVLERLPEGSALGGLPAA